MEYDQNPKLERQSDLQRVGNYFGEITFFRWNRNNDKKFVVQEKEQKNFVWKMAMILSIP